MEPKTLNLKVSNDRGEATSTLPAPLALFGRDYNEARPHSKLGWMTPRAYATALTGDVGRGAALRRGSAPRPLATHETEGSNQPRTLVSTG